MDEQSIIKAIVDEVLKRIYAHVQNNKQILALFSAGTVGLQDGFTQLERLRGNGYKIHTVLTPNAKKLFENSNEKFADELLSKFASDQTNPEQLIMNIDCIVIPVMTMNTAMKFFAGISDNLVTHLTQLGILHGKRIIAARNACCLDSYRECNPNYRRHLEQKLEALQEFGIEFTDVNELALRVRKESMNTTQNVHIHQGTILDAAAIRTTKQKHIHLKLGTLITPLAKDLAREQGIIIDFS